MVGTPFIQLSLEGPSAGGFIAGGALLISEGWGIPLAFAQTMLAVMVVLFAGTTMDAGLRLTRYIIKNGEVSIKLVLLKTIIFRPWLLSPPVCCLRSVFPMETILAMEGH